MTWNFRCAMCMPEELAWGGHNATLGTFWWDMHVSWKVVILHFWWYGCVCLTIKTLNMQWYWNLDVDWSAKSMKYMVYSNMHKWSSRCPNAQKFQGQQTRSCNFCSVLTSLMRHVCLLKIEVENVFLWSNACRLWETLSSFQWYPEILE